jgi:hypothetical protein
MLTHHQSNNWRDPDRRDLVVDRLIDMCADRWSRHGTSWYDLGMSTAPPPPRPQPILRSVAQCLTADVAREILSIEIEPAVQMRIRELAEKANEGLLNAAERSEYEAWIEDTDLLGIFKSLAQQALSG